jgi:hypothetical protein
MSAAIFFFSAFIYEIPFSSYRSVALPRDVGVSRGEGAVKAGLEHGLQDG